MPPLKRTATKGNVMTMPVTLLLAILAWRFSLDAIYVYFVSPVWSYTGLVCVLDPARYVLALAVQLFSLRFLNNMVKRSSVSDVGVLLLYLMAFMPGLSVISFVPTNWGYFIAFCLFWFLLLIFNEKLFTFKGVASSIEGRTGSKKHSQLVVGLLTIASILVVLYVSYRYAGFRINLDLFDVYDLRTEAREFDRGVFLTYAFGACRSLVPALTALFLVQKRWGVAAFLTLVALLMFSVDGMKSSIFAIFAVYAVFILARNRDLKKYVYGFAALGALCLMLGVLFQERTIIDSVLRRTLYLPTYLGYGYFDFFSNHELDLYRQGFLGRLGFSSPYSEGIAVIIGEQYYIGGNANSGLLADAFANFGMLGVIAIPFAVVVILRILEACSTGVSNVIVDSCALIIAYRMVNSFLPTILLTHGVLLLLVFMYFIPRGFIKDEKTKAARSETRKFAYEYTRSY